MTKPTTIAALLLLFGCFTESVPVGTLETESGTTGTGTTGTAETGSTGTVLDLGSGSTGGGTGTGAGTGTDGSSTGAETGSTGAGSTGGAFPESPYGPCQAQPCEPGEACIVTGFPSATCAWGPCRSDAECPPAPEGYDAICTDLTPGGDGVFECAIQCVGTTGCPNGMDCTTYNGASVCLWSV